MNASGEELAAFIGLHFNDWSETRQPYNAYRIGRAEVAKAVCDETVFVQLNATHDMGAVAEDDVRDDEFFIAFGKLSRPANLNLSEKGDLCEAASHLFAYLREAEKHTEYKGIAMSPVPQDGLGLAINDRIRRASYRE